MATKDYSLLSREDLVSLLLKYDEKKKYGIVWDEERVPEKVVTDCQTHLPVLTEVKEKEIITNPNELTHLLIEGDNYHTLSVLNYTHAGKIDLIYIDPPYNTGNKDFIYNDIYVDALDTYSHSKWLNFMDKRLSLASNLLSEDGFMVVSIDDNEIAHLKILLDKYFNHNTKIIAVKMSEASGLKMGALKRTGGIPKYKEYVVYAKPNGINNLYFDPIKKEDWDNEYNLFLENFTEEDKSVIEEISLEENLTNEKLIILDNDTLKKIEIRGVNSKITELGITDKKEILKWKYENSWRICRSTASSSVKRLADEKRKFVNQSVFSVLSKRDKLVYLVKGDYELVNDKPRVQLIFASDNLAVHPGDFWTDIKTTGLDAEGGIKFKNGKKPLELIRRIIKSQKNKNAIVLDFFAGSGTTAEAVLNLNAEDKGNRQFILCTYNEENSTGIKITDEFCYPRIKNTIINLSPKFPNVGSLKYFKTSFVENTRSRDKLRQNITKRCTQMLCIKDGFYNLYKEEKDWKIFKKDVSFMAIYYDFPGFSLEQLVNELNNINGDKKLYCFALSEKVDKIIELYELEDCEIEAIPQKLLEVYFKIFSIKDEK